MKIVWNPILCLASAGVLGFSDFAGGATQRLLQNCSHKVASWFYACL